MNYSQFIKSTQDFPKPWVTYWDFTWLLENPQAFKSAIFDIKNHFKDLEKVVAVEAKWFTIGGALAYELGLPLVLIRKPELTPWKTISEKFVKEYWFWEYHIKDWVIKEGEKVLIIYDIMAWSWASQAAINLVEKCWGQVLGLSFVIELLYLKWRENLAGYDLFSLVKIDEKQWEFIFSN